MELKLPVIPKVELTLYKALLSRDVDLIDIQEMNSCTLETSRTFLEPITEIHAPELYELFSDLNLHTYTPYMPLELSKQLEQCKKWSRRISTDGSEIWLNWAARDKNTSQVIAHFQAGITNKKIATIGYLVAKNFQGKSIATECLKVVFDHLRNDYGILEIKAYSDTRNIASHRLAEKMGMMKIETITNADHFKGGDAPSTTRKARRATAFL